MWSTLTSILVILAFLALSNGFLQTNPQDLPPHINSTDWPRPTIGEAREIVERYIEKLHDVAMYNRDINLFKELHLKAFQFWFCNNTYLDLPKYAHRMIYEMHDVRQFVYDQKTVVVNPNGLITSKYITNGTLGVTEYQNTFGFTTDAKWLLIKTREFGCQLIWD